MEEPPLHVGVDEVHAHPHKTGHRWVDMVVAFSAIAISVISLVVAVEHGRSERQLVAANSWPFLVYNSSLDYDFHQDGSLNSARRIDLRIDNSGVGPARIQSVVVKLDGRPVRDRQDLLTRCCGMPVIDNDQQVKLGLQSQNPVVGVLPAREGITFLAWRLTPGGEGLFAALNQARHRLTFSACYCSVLGECWVTDLKSTTDPRRVRRCEPEPRGYAG